MRPAQRPSGSYMRPLSYSVGLPAGLHKYSSFQISLSRWGHVTDVPGNHKECMWVPLPGRQPILLSLMEIEKRIVNVKQQTVQRHHVNKAFMSKCAIYLTKV